MRVLRLFLVVTGFSATGVAPVPGAPPQSPIKFENAANANLDVPQFNYGAPLLELTVKTQKHLATGTEPGDEPAKKKIEGLLPAGHTKSVTVSGDTYVLQEFHFHYGQEHQLGGNIYDLELHLVHKNPTKGNLAVGFWIEATTGAENAALVQIHDKLPAGPANFGDADETGTVNMFNLPALQPSDWNNFFKYDGSLTTFKKNSEVTTGKSETAVTWYFYKDPLKLTQAKINKFIDHPAMTGARAVDMNGGHNLQMRVPEPSTVWLLAVAGLVVAGRRRSR